MFEGRRLSVPPLVSLEGQRVGRLGSGGVERGIQDPLLNKTSTGQSPDHPKQLCPEFNQGAGSGEGDRLAHLQRGSRTRSRFARLLQPRFCGPQSFRGLASHHRPVSFEQVCGGDQVPDGNRPVGSVVSETGRLDGRLESEGHIPSGPIHPESRRYLLFVTSRGNFQSRRLACPGFVSRRLFQNRIKVLELCQALGILINLNESKLEPTQNID